MNTPRMSIIIPAYNEERYLAACLDCIAAQTVAPFEVLVVDNNSSDRTAEVAVGYSFVTLLHEPIQGLVYSRNTGMNAAQGDLLVRIDADTHLPPTWLETLAHEAAKYPDTAAFTGQGVFYDMPLPRVFGCVQVVMFQWLQWPAMRSDTLWGANMVLRRTAWGLIAESCHMRNDIDEDVDITLQLRKRGLTVRYLPGLRGEMSLRRDHTDPVSVARYVSTWPRDYAINGRPLAAVYMAFVTALVIAGASLAWLVTLPFRGRNQT